MKLITPAIINLVISLSIPTDLSKWDVFVLLTLFEVAAWVLLKQQKGIKA